EHEGVVARAGREDAGGGGQGPEILGLAKLATTAGAVGVEAEAAGLSGVGNGDQSDVAKDQIEVGEAGVGGVAKGFEALADLEAGRSEEEVKHFAGGVGGDDGVTGGGREHGGDLTLDQSGEVVGAVLDDFSAA